VLDLRDRKRCVSLPAVLAMCFLFCVSVSSFANRPNIVLILADDLGFSDIAPYGSEVNTPTISALAESGIKFSNFHTAASCAPSRGMLLTGVDSHRNGVPNIPEAIPPEQGAYDNYQGVLGHNVVTVATLLQDQGYHTYMAGKWHLGKARDQLPNQRGFERTIAMADTGADNWEQKPYIPIYEKANWFADGAETILPDNYYSSRFLVDKTIEFIESNAGSAAPFFVYLPFLAVHTPVQAPREFIEKYSGVYDEGWDTLRQKRFEKAVKLGLVPEGMSMVSMSSTEDWDLLTAEQRRYQSKRMAVYAAMIEAMDFHIGRLISHLKATGQYENTIFIFTSDNGSEATGSTSKTGPAQKLILSLQDYNDNYETLGLKGSFSTIGPSFASASASPLAYYKFYSGEGGMRVPLIIAGDRMVNKNSMSDAFTYVTDITPTILALTGVEKPPKRYGGRIVEPIIGRSLVPLVTGEVSSVYAETDNIGYELGGNAALFQGDYKISLNRAPLGDGKWHLYNIAMDPGEAKDLAASMPDKLGSMIINYQDYATSNGVLPVQVNYHQQTQVAINGVRDRFGAQILIFLSSLLLLVVVLVINNSYRRSS